MKTGSFLRRLRAIAAGCIATLSNRPSGHPLIGVSLDEMASAGWAGLEAPIDAGELATADAPVLTFENSTGSPLYDQWAKIVFESSATAYGMQDSDRFQTAARAPTPTQRRRVRSTHGRRRGIMPAGSCP